MQQINYWYAQGAGGGETNARDSACVVIKHLHRLQGPIRVDRGVPMRQSKVSAADKLGTGPDTEPEP